MNITELKDRPDIEANSKLYKIYIQFNAVLNELRKKKLTEDIIALINDDVATLNTLPTDDGLRKAVKLKQTSILKVLDKVLKIVPKNHYRTIWMLAGMSVFGLPIGITIGMSIGNIGLLGIGLPIGLAIGFAIGAAMDKKAFEQGRQLDVEIRY